MAGEVKCDHFQYPNLSIMDVVARQCPVTKTYGPVCVRFDPRSAEAKVCPFWYGLVVTTDGHHHGEARSIMELREWLASHELYSTRDYRVRCLRAESTGLAPGATRS